MRKVGLEVSIVYRIEYQSFLCCRMILGHPPPQASVSELYIVQFIKGVERQRGGSHFALEREWGDPIHTTAQKLWISIFYSILHLRMWRKYSYCIYKKFERDGMHSYTV